MASSPGLCSILLTPSTAVIPGEGGGAAGPLPRSCTKDPVPELGPSHLGSGPLVRKCDTGHSHESCVPDAPVPGFGSGGWRWMCCGRWALSLGAGRDSRGWPWGSRFWGDCGGCWQSSAVGAGGTCWGWRQAVKLVRLALTGLGSVGAQCQLCLHLFICSRLCQGLAEHHCLPL